ncbi:MAG: hypothetical protein BMS9Abin32_026 [Gammaproteobacteria bacterium]|nr:MAG: hypothetical protein BMS9Abin32_026 [Gammaproteobacteria bacterium]
MLSLLLSLLYPKLRCCAGAAPRATRLFVSVMAASLLTILPAADAAAGNLSDNWSLHGRLLLDGAKFDSNNPLFIDNSEVRRGRLSLSGNLLEGTKIKIEYELSGSTPGPKSMWFRQKLGKKTALTVGHFKVPISLQTATSSRYNTFMERALPNVGTSGYRLGVMATTYGKYWSASSGITGGRLTDQYTVDNEGVGFYARGVVNPFRSKNHLLHLGLSSEIRQFAMTDSIRVRSRPESDLTSIRMVDTLRFADLDQSFKYTAEFAWKHRSLNLQAEYTGLDVTRLTGADLSFNGWYAQASWFITGESRKYNRRNGSFRRTSPRNAYGAWEIAFRHSEIDLTSADILGGEETNNSVALNWYAGEHVRVSMNYIEAEARPNSLGLNDDVSIIQGRFQFIF